MRKLTFALKFKTRFRGLMATAFSSNPEGGKTNRLALEKSPYLLQHAHNPVDWYPWGEQAFERAKLENRMIFLSVGYSTCHWCHVMERESFENAAIGEIMNKNFVNIKVDREERPDVDKMYMGFVQATTGSGGWPLSVWLTPDLKPVVGGTYFPAENKYGRPGFAKILEYIASQWRDSQTKVEEQGAKLLEAITAASNRPGDDFSVVSHTAQYVKLCFEYFDSSFDVQWGGFGDAPKFPQPSIGDFLTSYYWYKERKLPWDESRAVKMVKETQMAMARGGIHDHVAQGFHRYSTDEQWHVPHFEKMLYDQAQLVSSFVQMYQITKDPFFDEIIRDVLTYVGRDLSHRDGGFYSAEDADSVPTTEELSQPAATEKREGAFCVWTDEQVRRLLGRRCPGPTGAGTVTLADVFCEYYTVRPSGNVDPRNDPHGELKGQNVLIVHNTVEDVAKRFELEESVVRSALRDSREILFIERQKRPKPHLDSKMLASWNGLMISAFFRAAAALNDESYAQRAIRALSFVRKNLFLPQSGTLLRSCYLDPKGDIAQIPNPINGFPDDYANMIAALLDAYDYTFDDQYLKWARELQLKMDELFFENNSIEVHAPCGAYFHCSKDDRSILIRLTEDHDGAEPSPNSMTALNQARLYNYTGAVEHKDACKGLLVYFGDKLRTHPFAMPKMMCALMVFDKPPTQIVIVGSKDDMEVKKMIDFIRSTYCPFQSAVLLDGVSDSYILSTNEHLRELKKSVTQPTAFICTDFACQMPVHTADDLIKRLID